MLAVNSPPQQRGGPSLRWLNYLENWPRNVAQRFEVAVTNRIQTRRAAGVTQNEVAVRARVSPMLARAYERLDDPAATAAVVPDPEARGRLDAVWAELARAAAAAEQGAAA